MMNKTEKSLLSWSLRTVALQSFTHVQLFATPWIEACQASMFFHVLHLPEVCWTSCPLSQWCHPTISSFVIPFSSCLWSFPASESLPVSQLFTSGGQSIGASASASVLPMDIQDWFPLGLTGLTSLLSKGLSRTFFSTTVWKHQFFGAQASLESKSHICTWLLEKTIALTIRTFVGKVLSAF